MGLRITPSRLDGLGDTIISSPAADELLKYTGAAWINAPGSSVNSGAGVDFFYDDTASDISTYQTLNRGPENVSESSLTGVSNNNRVLIKAYASASAGLGGAQIDAGEWIFDVYAKVDVIGAGLSSVDIDVYKRTSGGTETLLFNINSGTISGSTELYAINTVQQAFAINSTDRLVVKVYSKTTAIINRTVTFYYGGSAHYSNLSTPLVTRHNDLAALQGGQSGEYYHITAAQNTVVGNTSGVNTGDQPSTLTIAGVSVALGGSMTPAIFPNLNVLANNYTVPDNSTVAFFNTLTLNSNVSFTVPSTSTALVTTTGGDGEYWTSTVRVTGSNFITNSASLVNVTGLTYAAAVNSLYEVEAVLKVQASAGSGIKACIVCNASGATGRYYAYGNSSATATVTDANAIDGSATAAFSTSANIDGIIVLNAVVSTVGNTGNITVQVLKTTSGIATIYIGSIMKIKKLA